MHLIILHFLNNNNAHEGLYDVGNLNLSKWLDQSSNQNLPGGLSDDGFLSPAQTPSRFLDQSLSSFVWSADVERR